MKGIIIVGAGEAYEGCVAAKLAAMSSAERPSEPAAPPGALALGTCSLPVSSDILGTPLDSDPRFMADSLPGWALRASRHAWCPLRGPKTVEEMALLFVEELRREMGLPSLRQPEENVK